MVFEGIDAVEDAIAEILFSKPIPEVLQRIEFRGMGWKERQPLRDANCVMQGYAAQPHKQHACATQRATTAESACASVPTPARTPPRCRPAAPAHGAPRPAAIGP